MISAYRHFQRGLSREDFPGTAQHVGLGALHISFNENYGLVGGKIVVECDAVSICLIGNKLFFDPYLVLPWSKCCLQGLDPSFVRFEQVDKARLFDYTKGKVAFRSTDVDDNITFGDVEIFRKIPVRRANVLFKYQSVENPDRFRVTEPAPELQPLAFPHHIMKSDFSILENFDLGWIVFLRAIVGENRNIMLRDIFQHFLLVVWNGLRGNAFKVFDDLVFQSPAPYTFAR